MIILNLLLVLICLFILIKCADYSIKYSSILAKIFRWPEFIVSFFIISFISILPETTISIISAFQGNPKLGLGTLLGSNVADLSLVFGIVALFSINGIKVKSQILRNTFIYLILLLIPLILGFDGNYSRLDGAILLIVGVLFFVRMYLESNKFHKKYSFVKKEPFLKSLLLLIVSFGILLLSAYFTVYFATNLAYDLHFPPVLIGITILALGTCLPELIFSIRAVRNNHDGLALGDLFGTVIADATIVLGIVTLIQPFSFSTYTIYITGSAMFLSGLFAIIFMKSDKTITKAEGLLLLFLYIIFLIAELYVNTYLV